MEQNKFKIGYIDEETTWISTFQRNLSEDFEVVIFPLHDDTTLEGLVAKVEAEALDCLVVDYELRESSLVTFNGDDIINKVRETNPAFPVLIITGHEEDEVITVVEDTDIVRNKSELAERTELFIHRLKGKILWYKKKLRDINEEIQTLATKKIDIGLSLEEEEVLNDLYYQLDKINPSEKVLPGVMYEQKNISQLSDLIKETQEILSILKNNKS